MADGMETELSPLDRATLTLGKQLSRRSLFKGGLFSVAGLTGLRFLMPIEASACNNCHYCTSGCVGCGTLQCCSYGNPSTCQFCSGCGGYFYVKNYICDNYCGSWCATTQC